MIVDVDEHYERDVHGASHVLYNLYAYIKAKNLSVGILECTKVILQLHDCVKNKYAKQMVNFLHGDIFKHNKTRDMIKEPSAYTAFVQKKAIDSLGRDGLRIMPVLIKGRVTTGV